ncbi:hypothetical protein HDU81_000465, partial [Chytriomyces hyalinus]
MFRNIITLSDDDDNNDETDMPTYLQDYAIAQMSAGTFTALKFAKYTNWGYSRKERTESILKALMVICNKAREKMTNADKKARVKKCLRDLEALDTTGELSEWNKYWMNLQSKELTEKARQKRKLDAFQLLHNEISIVRKEETKDVAVSQVALGASINRIHPKALSPSDIPDALYKISQIVDKEANPKKSLLLNMDDIDEPIFKDVSSDLFEAYGDWLDRRWMDCPGDTVSDYLGTIFGQMGSLNVDGLDLHLKNIPKPLSPLESDVHEFVQATFPVFIRAFSDPTNPLQNVAATECEYLNEFVHPLLKESVFRFGGKCSWKSGEIPHRFFFEKNRADGVAKLSKGDLPVAYFEGARLSVLLGRKGKKEYDGAKIRKNCVSILQETVIEMLKLKKRVPLQLQSFGAQFFDGKLMFTVVDCF